jgi:hypothetical protein
MIPVLHSALYIVGGIALALLAGVIVLITLLANGTHYMFTQNVPQLGSDAKITLRFEVAPRHIVARLIDSDFSIGSTIYLADDSLAAGEPNGWGGIAHEIGHMLARRKEYGNDDSFLDVVRWTLRVFDMWRLHGHKNSPEERVAVQYALRTWRMFPEFVKDHLVPAPASGWPS